jgi:hypothetical protein
MKNVFWGQKRNVRVLDTTREIKNGRLRGDNDIDAPSNAIAPHL